MLYSQNIEILSRVIMDDAYREAEAILEKARKESESIKENAVNISNDMIFDNKSSSSQINILSKKDKIISLEELRIRSDVMEYQEQVLQGILQQVRKDFFSLPERRDYPEVLKRLIINALKHLQVDGNIFICRVNARDRSFLTLSLLYELGEKTGKEISLDTDPVDIAGGVILIRKDLRVLYDNSLEAIFERNREKMRCMAAEYIFGTVL